MSVTRTQVVAAARRYVDTPFQDKGRMLGVGLDCVGLPLMVAGDLGLSDKNGIPMNGARYADYTSQPLGNYVHRMCMKDLIFKPMSEMKEGDVLSIAVLTAPCHVAIVGRDASGQLTLIHAYSGGMGKVVEHPIDLRWKRRICACFTIPGVVD